MVAILLRSLPEMATQESIQMRYHMFLQLQYFFDTNRIKTVLLFNINPVLRARPPPLTQRACSYPPPRLLICSQDPQGQRICSPVLTHAPGGTIL